MVVMNPDQIVVLHILGYRVGKDLVGGLICFPCILIERDLTRMVVEEWPKNLICRRIQCEFTFDKVSLDLLEKPL